LTKATRTDKRIYARAIVVAASACESARLLLNSKSLAFPAGIANSSEQSAGISPILSGAAVYGYSHSSRRCPATITMALAACYVHAVVEIRP